MAPAYVEPLIEPYIEQFANRHGDKRLSAAASQQRRHMMHFTPPIGPQNDIARVRTLEITTELISCSGTSPQSNRSTTQSTTEQNATGRYPL